MHNDFPMGSTAHLHDLGVDAVGCLNRLNRLYGSVVAFAKGDERTIFAFGPDANYSIFTDTETYEVFGPPGPKKSSQRKFQNGLFGLNGAKHLEHRRMLMPAMRKETVAGQDDVMRRLIDDCLDGFRPGTTIDLYGSMLGMSLTVAGKLLFGLDEIPRPAELAQTFREWFDGYIAALFEMILPITFSGDGYNQMLAAAAQLEDHFREVIAMWTPRAGEPPTMLGILLEAKQAGRIADMDVIGEMQTLLNAAYQTTGSALTWTFLMLAQHPEVARRLLDELDDLPLGSEASSPYLDCVIKESLRILPPVVFGLRRTSRPGAIAGRAFAMGAVVVPSFYVTHHQSANFPDPERFWPERWIGARYSPYTYVPFGAGPRMCMGTAFALHFFKLVVPAFVKRFRLALRPGTRVDRHSSFTLGVEGKLPVQVLAQDRRFEAVELTGNIHEMVKMPQSAPVRRAA